MPNLKIYIDAKEALMLCPLLEAIYENVSNPLLQGMVQSLQQNITNSLYEQLTLEQLDKVISESKL